MCNVSSEAAGVGAGVLLRALEPLEGIELMEARRGTHERLDLARGPGRLAAALAIDRGLDGIDLCAPGRLWLAAGPPRNPGPSAAAPASASRGRSTGPGASTSAGVLSSAGRRDCAYNWGRPCRPISAAFHY